MDDIGPIDGGGRAVRAGDGGRNVRVFRLVGGAMPIGYCLVFGALISPTDPVTVLNVLRQLGIPRSLQAIIGGESMFNDGVGIVLYALFLQVALAYGHAPLTVSAVLLDFLREA